MVWMTFFMSSANAKTFINNDSVLSLGFSELQKSGFETNPIKNTNDSENSELEFRQILGVNYGFTYLLNHYSVIKTKKSVLYKIDIYGIEYGSILRKKIDIMDYAEFIPYMGMKISAGMYSHRLQTRQGGQEKDSVFTEKGELFFAVIPNFGFYIGVSDFYFTTGFFYQYSNGKYNMPTGLRKHLSDVPYNYNTNHSVGFSIGFLAMQHLYFEVSHGFVLVDSEKDNISNYSFLLGWMF